MDGDLTNVSIGKLMSRTNQVSTRILYYMYMQIVRQGALQTKDCGIRGNQKFENQHLTF